MRSVGFLSWKGGVPLPSGLEGALIGECATDVAVRVHDVTATENAIEVAGVAVMRAGDFVTAEVAAVAALDELGVEMEAHQECPFFRIQWSAVSAGPLPSVFQPETADSSETSGVSKSAIVKPAST